MKWNWLPSLCTIANLGAGVLSLYFTIHEQYMTAFILVVVAALWDVLDGLLARLLHCSSDFGKQHDYTIRIYRYFCTSCPWNYRATRS
nr:CDP-alcohol phosphatidyltransferase family protein [Paenibacillus polymyxa]